MKVVTRITFWDQNGEKFFGEGPARLLQGIELHGSLRSAAMVMDMAYTKALRLMKNAEAALGFPLITSVIGGKSGGNNLRSSSKYSTLCHAFPFPAKIPPLYVSRR